MSNLLADGKYKFQIFSGKDAVLIRDDDGYIEILSLIEFPEEFAGIVYPGETIHIRTAQRVWTNSVAADDRQREAFLRTQRDTKKRFQGDD